MHREQAIFLSCGKGVDSQQKHLNNNQQLRQGVVKVIIAGEGTEPSRYLQGEHAHFCGKERGYGQEQVDLLSLGKLHPEGTQIQDDCSNGHYRRKSAGFGQDAGNDELHQKHEQYNETRHVHNEVMLPALMASGCSTVISTDS